MKTDPLPGRAAAVDAMRGLAILGMTLVGVQPQSVLPAWMYHAQEPPPAHTMDLTRAGLTWPDLVFPIFIFTLGVAIPLALSRRIERGDRYRTILGSVFSRGALLVFFALFRQHFDSSVSGLEPDRKAWAIGLAAFPVLFAIFTRLPEAWGRARRFAVRAAGWTAAALMFALVRFPDGSRFRPGRIDIILLLLAYCAVFAACAWLVTQRSVLGRLAIVGLLASSRLVAYLPGWLNVVYEYTPVPWLYRFSMLQFLCVAIPGTIAGDLLLDSMRASRSEARAGQHRSWSTGRAVTLAGVLFLFVPVVLTGIQGRQLFATTAVAALLCVLAFSIARQPTAPAESLIVQLIHWGAFWLILGLILDPLDGGTKKVPETFAWFFQGGGIAALLLAAFTIVTDIVRKTRWLQLLVENGQNPMVGYVADGMFVLPLLGLTGVRNAVDSLELGPWLAFGWSVVLTLLVAYSVRVFVRLRLFWRS